MTDGEFKGIIIPQYRQMYATAFAILRDPDDASDAVQDTISSLWQKHDLMKPPDHPQAFCNMTIRNHCIDRLRQNSRRYFERIDTLYSVASESHADSEVSLSHTVSSIMRCLTKLNDRHKKILILSIFSQLSNNEISAVTGETSENVRVILSRGRKTLKEFLSHEK